MGTVIILAIIVVLAALGVKNLVKNTKQGCCGSGADAVKKVRVSDKNTANYAHRFVVSIEGMSCKSCQTRVENAFNGKEGCYAKVDLKKKQATVYVKGDTTEADIAEAVNRAGYEVTGVEQLA